ncbi:hypothetical protein AVEN_99764-1 [Araneus ventricosus]|uniref:ATP-dependent DNA helicase n=1 Tax=Araneus ventricosus TaxID=182803 RepID=A0A4Y2DMJ9_ARAVE|nr:hypothetical protein AVEN_99764-1 [Araneus ventricosus]
MPNIIEATIITEGTADENVFIPRISIIPSDFPFQFKRLQLPVRLIFAMSINKAQVQFLGLRLLKPCFSHGQLYEDFSRVGKAGNQYILAPICIPKLSNETFQARKDVCAVNS